MDNGLRPVLISHPVHQHSYQTVVAAQREQLLSRFFTGIYWTGRGMSGPRIMSLLPPRQRRGAERMLRRRWHPEIDPRLVEIIPAYHLLAALARRGPWRAAVERWADDRFDAAVGRRLGGFPSVRLVHGWEGSALATLRVAADRGLCTVLDVPSAFEYFDQAIVAEGGPSATARHTNRVKQERSLAGHLFAPSEFVVRCLLENGVDRNRIVKIPYGVDPDRFRPVSLQRDPPFRCLFVGLVGLRKGVRYLLEAWRRLDLPESELVIVGSADQQGEAILREHAGHHRWIGPVASYEVHRWFQQSDVFVFPSLAEGSAYVTYQAMAAGLPIITTPNSGSVARDGVDGFVVEPRDINALCDRILALYRSPELRRQMSHSGRERIVGTFTWDHYYRRVVDAYRAILSGDDPQRAVDQAG